MKEENINSQNENCKIDKNQYKKSIYESGLPAEQINLIWDFYVTHQIIKEKDIKDGDLYRSVKDYGWKTTTSTIDGYPALEFNLAHKAEIDEFIIIKADSINKHLAEKDLKNSYLSIDSPRAVLKQKYSCKPNEDEIVQYESMETRVAAILRHVRNALAHGNTYFFDNGKILLEDKDGATKISAEILVNRQTLLDWIFVVDKDEKYYSRKMSEEENNGTIDS